MTYSAPTPQPLSPADEKLWAMLIHLGGIILWFLPSLIGHLVLKDRGPFVRDHTRWALNFQITMAIGWIASVIVPVIGGLVGFAVGVVVIVFSIIAAVAANRGQFYKYPLAIEFIK